MGAKSGQKSRKARPQRLALIVFGALFVVLLIGFAIAQGIGQPSVPSGDVALVKSIPDGEGTVSDAELKRAMLQTAAQSGLKKTPQPGDTKYEELLTSALGGLLDRVWIVGQAEELGLVATDKEIETALNQIKEQNFPTPKAYAEFLATSKLSQEDVDNQVELQVLSEEIRNAIIAKAPQPSKDEIADYYEAAKAAQFTTKPTRDVRLVVNNDKAEVEAAKAELEKDDSPASWKKVAAKYSTDQSTKSKGGLQPAISEEVLAALPVLKKVIFESATGEIVGPVKYQGSYTLIEVVKLNPQKVQALEEVSSTIATQLQQEGQEKFFEDFVTEYQAKWESRTFCASGFEIERCSNYPSAKRVAKEREQSKGCYEANPKVPAKECPALVTQNAPAVPGSVTVLKPQGNRLPQGPIQPAPAGKAGKVREALREGAEEAPGE